MRFHEISSMNQSFQPLSLFNRCHNYCHSWIIILWSSSTFHFGTKTFPKNKNSKKSINSFQCINKYSRWGKLLFFFTARSFEKSEKKNITISNIYLQWRNSYMYFILICIFLGRSLFFLKLSPRKKQNDHPLRPKAPSSLGGISYSETLLSVGF